MTDNMQVQNELVVPAGPVIHVRHGGRSTDVSLQDLDLGDLSTNVQILTAVERHVGAPAGTMSKYVVEREQGGNFTVRPEATFG